MPRIIRFASDTDGSLISTFWNLRSNARSFSKYFLNSSKVVEPIQCNFPFDNAGFIKLAISIDESFPELPAPIIIGISSINKIGSFTTSKAFNIFLILSSISPRYLVPAINAPISRDHIVDPNNGSGTSPSTIFLAKPSTTCVFPVPGSPTKIGLFFVRLANICETS